MAARHFRNRRRRPEDGVWGGSPDVDFGGGHGEGPFADRLVVGLAT